MTTSNASIRDKGLIKGENLRLSPNDILLDNENPRFGLNGEAIENQDKIIVSIIKRFGINDLLSSISNNGYFDEEPIVVIPSLNGKYIVLEGNRRIVTIKLLLEPEKYQDLLDSSRLRIKIPLISDNIKADILNIPVVKYEKRNDVLIYLGVKHITGVEPWGAYAKGVYIAKLIEEYDTSIDEISNIIGDGKKIVGQTYVAYKLLEQFRKYNVGVDITEIEDNFSYLQLLVNNGILKNYIGLKTLSEIEDINSPIEDENIKNLSEMFGWLFGIGGEKVIKESREITKLGHVISKELSLDILKNTNNLTEAYDYSNGEIEVLNKRFRQLEKIPSELRTIIIKLHSGGNSNFILENIDEYKSRMSIIKALVEDLEEYIIKIS